MRSIYVQTEKVTNKPLSKSDVKRKILENPNNKEKIPA